MHRRSTLQATITWACPGAIVLGRITPIAASLPCLITISLLALPRLRLLVAMPTSRAAPALNHKCTKLCNVVLVSTGVTKPTLAPLLTTRVAMARRTLTTTTTPAPDIERTNHNDELRSQVPCCPRTPHHMPFAGGSNDPVLSFLIGRITQNRPSLCLASR